MRGLARTRLLAATVGIVGVAGLAAVASGAPPAGPGPGGPATRRFLEGPGSIAIDRSGNLYVSESVGNRVDRIAPNGTLVVIAGHGVIPGSAGDGGPASRATLNDPAGLALGRDGSLVIVEHAGRRIRVIDRRGRISTLPGSVETLLSDPIGVAVAKDGSVVVADELNARIVRFERSGRVVTVAGGVHAHRVPGDGGPATAAKLAHPTDLLFDRAGNLLFTDFFANRVRRIDRRGVITTVAGTGKKGFAGDGGPATAARLSAPAGLALDAAGNLYVADGNNRRIRRIDRRGTITTVAGTGVEGFAGDGGPATDARFDSPAGIAFDPAGNLYVADPGNNRVRRVDTHGVITTVAGRG